MLRLRAAFRRVRRGVEYVTANVSRRLINAMSSAAYAELLTTPDMAAIKRPVTA